MVRKCASRVLCWATLVSVAVVFAAVEQPTLRADTPVKKMLSKRRSRLPAHYASVVNAEQREKISKIQEEYQPKIDALQAQVDALKKELKEKIAAVLTAEQKKQIEEAAAKAKEKSVKPAESATTPPPAEPKPAK